MKFFFIGICTALCVATYAQTVTNKTYAAQGSTRINLKFDYPIVLMSTWDKNEISVTAKVKINNDENDDAFNLEEQMQDGTIMISGHIANIDKLPKRYAIVHGGQKSVYKSKEQFIQAEKTSGVERLFEGADIDVVVEIKIPSNCVTNINAIYGIVELVDFNAPVTIDALYGGIDATLNPQKVGKIKATTCYGQIYSNLDLPIMEHTEKDFFNSITVNAGNGPAFNFTSTYGKIYIRKP